MVPPMRPLRIIVTACGCPGASTLIRMLKKNGERDIEIIGTDMDNEAIGRFLTDRFYQVPAGTTDAFVPAMLELCEREQPDILFPESSNEVYNLACNKAKFEALGTKMVVSDPEPIATANDKYEMYERLRRETDLSLPGYRLVEDLTAFRSAAKALGYPDRPVVFKPPVGKGSRGVRIIDPAVSRKEILLEKKPNSKYMSMSEFVDIFEDEPSFPPFLVMEYIEGMEYTTDSLCFQGEELLTTVKTVEEARWGVIVRGELVRNDELVKQTRQILDAIPLSYCVNIQFIGERLIEINPRVSTFIYQNDLIAPYLAIKLALGECTPEDIRAHRDRIDYGRRMVRYMDQVFHRGHRLLD